MGRQTFELFKYRGSVFELMAHNGDRFYSKIKCAKWGDKGYYLGADRKSHKQLKAMTYYINHEEEVIDHHDCPF